MRVEYLSINNFNPLKTYYGSIKHYSNACRHLQGPTASTTAACLLVDCGNDNIEDTGINPLSTLSQQHANFEE